MGLLRNAQVQQGGSRRTTIMRRPSGVIGGEDKTNEDILAGAEQFAPIAYKLVSTAKAVSPQVGNEPAKQVSWKRTNENFLSAVGVLIIYFLLLFRI